MTFGGHPSPEPPEEDLDAGYDSEPLRSSGSRGQRSHTFSYGAPQPPSHPQRANTYPIGASPWTQPAPVPPWPAPGVSPWTQPTPANPWPQPPSSYNQPRRESSRSRSGSGSHSSRSRAGSHSQIEEDVETDSERLAQVNAYLNKNHNRPGPGMPNQRQRNTSFSGTPPGVAPLIPPMVGYGGPSPPQPQQSSSRYMKPYRKSSPPQTQWLIPPDSYEPHCVQTAESVAWDPPVLPWMFNDPALRKVDYKHPPQPVVFFDIAFDPRGREYEVKCMRPGQSRLSSLTREEEDMAAAGGSMSAPTMIIVNDMFPNWTVVVRSKRVNCRVYEVFRAIYDTYAQPLTPQEMMMIPKDKMPGVMAAFEQRCKDGPGLPPVEMAKGPKRVDVLRSERFFKALEYVPGEGLPINLWKLKLEKVTRKPKY
ncbi:hypothetical protein NMY22_g12599 [Coprinellus aureogranulatus]|nr:hypothetical protein NMY22_g12599 [Coprinellus aureogranulatus]